MSFLLFLSANYYHQLIIDSIKKNKKNQRIKVLCNVFNFFEIKAFPVASMITKFFLLLISLKNSI